MRVLNISYGYGSSRSFFLFPDGIECAEDFAGYVTDNQSIFIPLTRLDNEHCVHPYYIEEQIETVFVYGAGVSNFSEDEVIVLPEKEYAKRLHGVIKTLCVKCEHYHEDMEGDNLRGHWEKLCLDGTCWGYEAIDEKKSKEKKAEGDT